MPFVLLLIIIAVIFVIILTLLGLQPGILNRLMGKLILITGVAGVAVYGYGYYCLYGASVLTVQKTLISAFGIFLGRNDIGEISQVPFLASEPMQAVLYLISIVAMYATASAVIAGIGGKLIRILRIWSVHHKNIILIYGVNEDSVRFSERLKADKNSGIIFVDDASDREFSSRIIKIGAILLEDERSVTPEKGFVSRIGLKRGTQRLSVFCLSRNTVNNLRYAENLKNLLEEEGIRPDQTAASLLVLDGAAGELLQARKGDGSGEKDKYGYGSVFAIEQEELAARLLIHRFPPCRTLRFDQKARAGEDFNTLIVGFGKTGQAVLRALIMNGQFPGSRFHAAIVADQYSISSGSFFYDYPGIKEHYDIDILEINSRSVAFYEYLSKTAGNLRFVAVCTGEEQENNEIAAEIGRFLKNHGSRAKVVQCTGNGLVSFSETDGLPVREDLFMPEILSPEELDAGARILNHEYHRMENHSIAEDWAACDYFSRQSCRASADFMDAFLCMSGTDRGTVCREGWPDDPEVLENLSAAEYERWCAFHYANGYRRMPREVFDERGEAYSEEIREKGCSGIRIGKDTKNRLHACLVPWEELDELSEREARYTKIRKDYRKMDLDNVLMIPGILKQAERSRKNQKE